MPTPAPKISVYMITCNHESFIRKAVESVMMQRTGFDYELVIGEDCSADATRKIVLDLEQRYPGRIRLLLQARNLGAQENARRTLQSCRGDYIAAIEGDDYWTDPEKLQTQVDFLDSRPEYALCAHRCHTEKSGLVEAGDQWDRVFGDREWIEVDFRNFLDPYLLVTLAVVWRRRALASWFSANTSAGDLGMWAWMLERGKGAVLNRFMGVYRLHPNSFYGMRSPLERAAWNFKQSRALLENHDRTIPSLLQYHEGALNTYVTHLLGEARRSLQSARAHYARAQELARMYGDPEAPSVHTIYDEGRRAYLGGLAEEMGRRWWEILRIAAEWIVCGAWLNRRRPPGSDSK
ncbi:MAG: glycosyltransferase [Verrucomicrobiota bacterium]|nr:glycosyltransferase [Verrucomicrobiota bacterium]